jgi:hypothetical protein
MKNGRPSQSADTEEEELKKCRRGSFVEGVAGMMLITYANIGLRYGLFRLVLRYCGYGY